MGPPSFDRHMILGPRWFVIEEGECGHEHGSDVKCEAAETITCIGWLMAAIFTRRNPWGLTFHVTPKKQERRVSNDAQGVPQIDRKTCVKLV